MEFEEEQIGSKDLYLAAGHRNLGDFETLVCLFLGSVSTFYVVRGGGGEESHYFREQNFGKCV